LLRRVQLLFPKDLELHDTETRPRNSESKRSFKVAYRPDIDGLRAIAVSSVVITHAGLFEFVKGGYIGVDVFFVISGYLISSILFAEIAEGKFSIVQFYRRRVLRIVPALLAVITATTIAAYLYCFPTELEAYSKSALATLAFVSNIFFWTQTGYFDAAALSKPLLHTWSLAIEEQFYIFFPLFLYVCHRYWPRYVRHFVAVACAASLVLSVIAVIYARDAAFYLVQYRAWELLLGVVVAQGISMNLGSVSRNIVALVGLGLIILPCFLYDSATPFPGLAAIPPCLGTALIIFVGGLGDSLVARLLSTKPFVFVGLISYSFYLWHWPILVFQQLGMPFPQFSHTKTTRGFLVLVAFVLAVLSWRFVERPFRQGWIRALPTQRIFLGAFASVVLLFAANLSFEVFGGFPERLPPNAARVASYLSYDADPYYRSGKCFMTGEASQSRFDYRDCLARPPGKPVYLLVGESNAAHLYPGLAQDFAGDDIIQVTATGCKPTLRQMRMGGASQCEKLMDYVFTDYLPKHHVDKLLLAALWTDTDIPALRETLQWGKDKHIPIVLFGPIPRYNVPLPRLIAASMRDGDKSESAVHANLVSLVEPLDRQMAETASQYGAEYISLYHVLCRPNCTTLVGANVPIQFDDVHLTYEGSVYLADLLKGGGYLR